MSSIPLALTYGIDTKSRWGIVNGLRRCAGVSLFLPLITIGLKMAAQQYAMSVAASADQTNRIAPMYQQYAEAIDLIVGQFSFRGIAVIDLMIATLTLTVFGVVISVRLRQSADNRGPRRAIILAGLAMILAMYSLNIRWPGGQFLTPAKRAASSPYQPANQLGRSLEMAIPVTVYRPVMDFVTAYRPVEFY